MTPRSNPSPARGAAVGLLTAAVGLAIFVYTVRRAGIGEILEGLGRVGAGSLLILALSGVRELVRTLAWIRSIDPPHRLPFGDALAARITGEALGNVTPFGLLLSEPSKATLVGNRVPPLVAFAALAGEQILYSLSVTVVIASGLMAFLLTYPLPQGLRVATMAALVGVVGLLALAGVWLIRAEPKIVTGLIARLSRLGLAGSFLERWVDDVRATEDRIFGLYGGNTRRLLGLSLLEAVFHAAAMAEVYVTLALVGGTAAPTLLTVFILESVNRAINVVFKFVPLRLGVDEAGTGLVAQVLGYGTAVGVTLAIVRKARVLCWSGLGIALLIGRGLSVRTVLDEAASSETVLVGEAPAEQPGQDPGSLG